MPGVDILTYLGAAEWADVDGIRLNHMLQRARYDFIGVASRRALAGDLSGNAEVKPLLDENPQVRGWVVVNPAYPERSAEQFKRYVGSAKWLGATLVTSDRRESLISPTCRELINAYRRYSKPLLVSIRDETAVRELEALASEFNTMKFVAAGAGGDDWQSCVVAAKRTVNIFLEPFSGGPHRGKLEAITAALGPNRVVFSSSFPDGNPGAALGQLIDSTVSDGEKQAILGGNAMRLFALNRSSE